MGADYFTEVKDIEWFGFIYIDQIHVVYDIRKIYILDNISV